MATGLLRPKFIPRLNLWRIGERKNNLNIFDGVLSTLFIVMMKILFKEHFFNFAIFFVIAVIPEPGIGKTSGFFPLEVNEEIINGDLMLDERLLKNSAGFCFINGLSLKDGKFLIERFPEFGIGSHAGVVEHLDNNETLTDNSSNQSAEKGKPASDENSGVIHFLYSFLGGFIGILIGGAIILTIQDFWFRRIQAT